MVLARFVVFWATSEVNFRWRVRATKSPVS
jgi:hypothetical protein